MAAIEIPVMIFSSRLAERFSKSKLIVLAFICAMIFYLGIFFATDLWHFILLQCINGLYYGLYAGLGLTLMQEQTQDKVGFVSAVYSNAMRVGIMLGTAGAGIIAQFSRFQYANLGSMCVALLAVICMIIFLIIQKSNSYPAPSAVSETG